MTPEETCCYPEVIYLYTRNQGDTFQLYLSLERIPEEIAVAIYHLQHVKLCKLERKLVDLPE